MPKDDKDESQVKTTAPKEHQEPVNDELVPLTKKDSAPTANFDKPFIYLQDGKPVKPEEIVFSVGSKGEGSKRYIDQYLNQQKARASHKGLFRKTPALTTKESAFTAPFRNFNQTMK